MAETLVEGIGEGGIVGEDLYRSNIFCHIFQQGRTIGRPSCL